MSDVVSINRGMVLGSYVDAQNKERIPEEVLFVGGVILAVMLPSLVLYSTYGGLSLLAFAATTFLGVVWGRARYYRSAQQVISRVFMGLIPQSPQDESMKLEDAA